MNSIFTSPVFKLEELNYVYIVLTTKSCNQRCKQCYIDFPIGRQQKDFIDINKIKEMISQIKNNSIECIYLTGAEPMTHPGFNNILRLCLKRTNVCICTNASFINEKKARFLRKVEDESKYSLFFRFSLSHYDELKNDNARYRGSYRQTLFAMKNLERYGFSIVLEIVNFYREEENMLLEMFRKKFEEYGVNPEISIGQYFDRITPPAEYNNKPKDCTMSRTLTQNGVYTCPYLANDYRGRSGSSFKDYSKSVNAETDYCMACSACKTVITN